LRVKRFVLFGLASFLVGCGSGGRDTPDTVDVSGKVTINGQAVEGVEVNFINEAVDFAGFGKTDAQGNFRLVSGAAPGENKIYFSKIEGGGDIVIDPAAGMDEEQLRAMAQGGQDTRGLDIPKQVVPPEYSDPTQTKLKFPVPEGGTDKANFNL
jgi:hypothetical protein